MQRGGWQQQPFLGQQRMLSWQPCRSRLKIQNSGWPGEEEIPVLAFGSYQRTFLWAFQAGGRSSPGLMLNYPE